MEYKYKTAICAGTFDKLHEGHLACIRYAFFVAEKVYVTITSDKYTAKHKPNAAPFAKRFKNISDFLKKEELFPRAIILPIDDVYGITLDVSLSIDALVVTKDSLLGAKKVNDKRMSFGLPPLAIDIVPITQGEIGIKISSSHIKTGIINTKGQVAIKNTFSKTNLILPISLREQLQKPFGKIQSPEDVVKNVDNRKLIAVGDITTQRIHEAGGKQALSVIDFTVERKVQNKTFLEMGFTGKEIVLHADNPSGTITPSLWEELEKAFLYMKEGKEVVLVVNGEEDLAVLPLLLLAPNGYEICYGQPHEGMVLVPVATEVKEQAIHILSGFVRE